MLFDFDAIMLKKLKIMQSVFASYIICQASTLLVLFLLSSVIYAQTTIKTEIRVLPEGMLKEISEIETLKERHPFEPEMVRIPAGEFTMGEDNNDEIADPSEPVHGVTIPYDFEVSQYEITRGEFQNFFDDPNTENDIKFYEDPICQGTGTGNRITWQNITFGQTDDHPVVCVSWNDVQAYIDWLNSTTGKVYRLLSESEWEYAARAEVSTKYSIGPEGSDDITTDDANYVQSGERSTVAVGTYEPNRWGLYDVHGNVSEWVQDCWHWGYAATTDTGIIFAPNDGSAWETECQTFIFGTLISRDFPAYPPDGTGFRAFRGGSFGDFKGTLTLTYRAPTDRTLGRANGYDRRSSTVGFRLARTIPESGPIPAPKLTSPPSGTVINIQSTSTEVRVVVEAESAVTISLELADDGELVVNPPMAEISLARNMKEASFTLTAVGGGSTMLTLTVRDLFGGEDTRNIRVNGPNIYPEMVKVPTGAFAMGSRRTGAQSEKPRHGVFISYSFAVGKFELTQAQYGAFVTANSHRAGRDWNTGINHDNYPVAHIRVSDVEAYVNWLSTETGQKYRLLSESEWEYAARARTETTYSTGRNSITTATANYNNSSGGAVEVGGYAANAWGLHDVHGNVSEWVADCWHDNYENDPPTRGSVWDSDCDDSTSNVYRGGSFNETANGMRSAKRFIKSKTKRSAPIGVRIARTLDEDSDPNTPSP